MYTKSYAWTIFLLAGTFFLYEYLLRIMPSVMTHGLMQEFHESASGLGILGGSFFIAYAAMQPFVGIILDRFNPLNVLLLACGCCILGVLLFGKAYQLNTAIVARVLMGLGASFSFIGAVKLAVSYLPYRSLGLSIGMLGFIAYFGAMLCQNLMSWWVIQEGWRATNFFFLGIGLFILIAFLLVRKNNGDNPAHLGVFKFSYVAILMRQPTFWLSSLIGLLIYFPTASFAELWGVKYFEVVDGYAIPQATLINSMIFLGWGIGGPLFGYWSDKIRQRKILILGASIAALIFLYIMLKAQSRGVTLFSALFFGIFSAAQMLIFSIIKEIAPENSVATGAALMNMFILLGGFLGQFTVSHLLDFFWHREAVNSIYRYSSYGYQQAMLILPCVIILAIGLSCLLRETYQQGES